MEKDVAFITLTMEEAREELLTNGLSFHQEKLKVSITNDKGNGKLLELQISTTLVVINLPRQDPQIVFSKTLR